MIRLNSKGLGILSAATASACCLAPAVLVAIGLGGLGAGLFVARFSGLLVGLAAAFLALGWWLFLAEAKRCNETQCQMPGRAKTLVVLAAASVVVAGFGVMHLWPVLSRACAASCPR